MEALKILAIGGGIGGLTAAITRRGRGDTVEVVERDPHWSVCGVGIIQQANVVRAMAHLDLLDDYLAASVSFDAVEVFLLVVSRSRAHDPPADRVPRSAVRPMCLHRPDDRAAWRRVRESELSSWRTRLPCSSGSVTGIFSPDIWQLWLP